MPTTREEAAEFVQKHRLMEPAPGPDGNVTLEHWAPSQLGRLVVEIVGPQVGWAPADPGKTKAAP